MVFFGTCVTLTLVGPNVALITLVVVPPVGIDGRVFETEATYTLVTLVAYVAIVVTFLLTLASSVPLIVLLVPTCNG